MDKAAQADGNNLQAAGTPVPTQISPKAWELLLLHTYTHDYLHTIGTIIV